MSAVYAFMTVCLAARACVSVCRVCVCMRLSVVSTSLSLSLYISLSISCVAVCPCILCIYSNVALASFIFIYVLSAPFTAAKVEVDQRSISNLLSLILKREKLMKMLPASSVHELARRLEAVES